MWFHELFRYCWKGNVIAERKEGVDEIHKASAGIPRMINRICEKALMYAFQNQKRLIDDYMIKYVVEHEMIGTMTT